MANLQHEMKLNSSHDSMNCEQIRRFYSKAFTEFTGPIRLLAPMHSPRAKLETIFCKNGFDFFVQTLMISPTSTNFMNCLLPKFFHPKT